MVKKLPANAGHITDVGWIAGSRISARGGNGNPLVFLPGKSYEQRSAASYSPWGRKRAGHN